MHRPRERQVTEIDAGLDQIQHQRGSAHLQVGGGLSEVGITDDHVQPAVLVGVGVRLVAGVDDAAFESGLQAHLNLDVVGTLGQLETGLVAGRSDPDAAGPGDDLPAHHEGRQPGDDRREGGLSAHEVVLVGAVGGALAVDIVLVQLEFGCAGHARDMPGGGLHHTLTGFVPDDRIHRIGDLGSGVLGMGVIDVEPGAVGQDHVGCADFVRVDHRHRPRYPAQIKPTRVAQRRFHLVIPPGALGPRDPGRRSVGEHRLG